MTNDQMEKCIFAQEKKSGLNLFSKKVYSTISVLIIFCVYAIMTTSVVHAEEATDGSTTEYTVSDTGIEAGSALATMVYFPAKVIFALGGGIVGGLTYAFTGGDEEATNKVWHTSMEGDYMVEPENLTGEKPIHFIGPDK